MDQSRLDAYRHKSTMPLLINGLLFMANLVASLVDPDQVITRWVFYATWAVFLIDYLIQLILSPVKWRFVVQHPLTLVSLFFPPLRIWLLIGVAYRAFKSKTSSLQGRVGYAAIYFVAVTIVFGALFEWFAERGDPTSHIATYGDSLWWTVVSITTVGYGDMVPVTAGGRVIATIIIAVGIMTLGLVTASITGYFIRSDKGSEPPDLSATAERVTTLLDKMDELKERLDRLENHRSVPEDSSTSSTGSEAE